MWSIGHGLPYVFNVDEQRHFVSPAIAMFGGSFDPHYFRNPPALTYLLHVVFRVRFTPGSPLSTANDVRDNFAIDPTSAFLLARVVVAILGTAAVGLVYVVGKRVFDKSCRADRRRAARDGLPAGLLFEAGAQ